MMDVDPTAKKDRKAAQEAPDVKKHTEFAPPYPHNSPNEQELDPLTVRYLSVSPPVLSDGKNEIKLPLHDLSEDSNAQAK